MKRLCVFCGSGSGAGPAYLGAAAALANVLVREHVDLVFGGARVGLMGELARGVLRAGGHVIGVIPKALVDKELACADVNDLRIVDSMHERKALMAELSDGFVALPGGLGTLEEIFEMLTWAQLGLHQKPCGILNVRDYYAGLLAFLDHSVDQRFVARAHRDMLIVERNPDALIERFRTYQPPLVDKAAWAIRGAGQPS
jgi:uncharacterized protein (TIGR00730 family)